MFEITLIPGKGRGLRATRAIPADTVIIHDPATRLRPDDDQRLADTALWEFYYFRETDQGMVYYLCFGPGSLINHADRPNIAKSFEQDEIGEWIVIRALRDIAAGEELCFRYTDPAHFGIPVEA